MWTNVEYIRYVDSPIISFTLYFYIVLSVQDIYVEFNGPNQLYFKGQQHMWRWTGFNMGLDLIVTYDNGNLSLKRYK